METTLSMLTSRSRVLVAEAVIVAVLPPTNSTVSTLGMRHVQSDRDGALENGLAVTVDARPLELEVPHGSRRRCQRSGDRVLEAQVYAAGGGDLIGERAGDLGDDCNVRLAGPNLSLRRHAGKVEVDESA